MAQASPSSDYVCDICHKQLRDGYNFEKHRKICGQKWQCSVCDKELKSLQGLTIHEKSCKKRKYAGIDADDEKKRKISSEPCGSNSNQLDSAATEIAKSVMGNAEWDALDDHEKSEWLKIYRQLVIPERPGEPPMSFLNQFGTDEQEILVRNWGAIRSYSHVHRGQSIYNIQIKSSSMSDLEPEFNEIMSGQKFAFKANASLGFILRNKNIPEKLRYYHSSINNHRIFENPALIDSQKAFEKFITDLKNKDLLNHAIHQRPGSEWVVDTITNVSVYVNHMDNYPIMARTAPTHVKNRQGVIVVDSSHNMCFFHCLALFRNESKLNDYIKQKTGHIRTKNEARILLKQFTETPEASFKGIKMFDIDSLEERFRIGVKVYTLEKNGKGYAAVLLRRPNPEYNKVMTLDHSLYGNDNHFSLIFDLKKYSRAFKCTECQQYWKTSYRCERHSANCNLSCKEIFPSGYYENAPSIFERLNELDIYVTDIFYPYRACFDFESILKPMTGKYVSEHVAVSFSVASNIPGHEGPKFYNDPSPDTLVKTLLDVLNEMSDVVYSLLRPKYTAVFYELRKRSDEINKSLEIKTEKKINKPNYYDRLCDELNTWIRRLPVLSFNGKNYDLNVIKIPLMKILKGPDCTILKRNNSFLAIMTEKLKILDITNYLSAGCSYSEYLKAFKVEEQKGFFPYEHVKAYEQLAETTLPPYESFYSSLNSSNPLERVKDEKTGETCFKEKVGRANYAALQVLWREQGMTTLMDLLKWYNNLDVSGFILALDKQFAFYKHHLNLDMFKEGISLPALSLRYAINSTDAKFALLGKKFSSYTKDFFENGIIGGPSLVFNRHQEAGVTKIKEAELGSDAATTQQVMGQDAVSMYLWAFSQDQPVGDFYVRNSPHFIREKNTGRQYSKSAICWLNREASTRRIKILHAENGREIPIGPRNIKVDGFCPSTKQIFQYQGCFHHGCEICNAHRMSKRQYQDGDLTFFDARQRTRETTQYLKDCGFEVIERWECEDNYKNRSNLNIARVFEDSDILDDIRSGKIFGIVKVDIKTPEHLKSELAEFPPIFKHAAVSRDDIGPHMRNYCVRSGALSRPSNMLISSFHADNYIIITPLLKFYMEIGLVVTRVHYVVEFPDHRPCFKQFADRVTDARREGDKNKNSNILANTFKLVGNSVYGRMCMDRTKHTSVHYVNGIEACHKINRKHFKKCHRLDEDLFEIELKKNKIVYDLPVQSSLFVYGNAKLKLLQFQYGFMKRYLNPRSYQLTCCDTDSLYFGLSTVTIEKAVKSDSKWAFYTNYDQWFPTLSCERHKDKFVETKLAGRPWVLEVCCKEAHHHAIRTPGLFKEEFRGLGIIALCSKTYIAWGDVGNKISAKGIQKQRNFENLTKEKYLKVLQSQQSGKGTNKGFRVDNDRVYTYEQEKYGLSYLYGKRKVLSDGVSTRPLTL